MSEIIVARRHAIRVTLLFVNLILFVVFISIGSLTPVSQTVAQELYNSIVSIPINPETIFLHNLTICLIEIIPLLGFFFYFLSAFASGISISAISLIQGSSSVNDIWLLLNNYPHTWLEFFAYTLAASESIMMILILIAAATKPALFRRELKIVGLTVLACASLLGIGSIFETAAIFFGKTAVIVTWIIFGFGAVAAVYYDAKRRRMKLPHPLIPLLLVEAGTILGFALPTLLVFVTVLWVKHVRVKNEGRPNTEPEAEKSHPTQANPLSA
jgi:hypothetical protein